MQIGSYSYFTYISNAGDVYFTREGFDMQTAVQSRFMKVSFLILMFLFIDEVH